MNIDIHAHYVDREYLQALQLKMDLQPTQTEDGKTLYRHNGYTVAWSRDDMFDIEHRLREMDRKGIDVRVLSVSTPNVYPFQGGDQVSETRRLNDALAALCRAHPSRFRGFASLPLADIPASLSEIDRAVDELDLQGVMIGSNIDGLPLTDSRFEPVWKRIDALRLPVFEHPMFPKDTANLNEFELPLRVGLIFDTTLAATRMIYAGIFERYPNFPYIMAHTGGALPMLFERLDNGYRLFPDCRKHISRPPSDYARRLYYDTAAFDQEALMLAFRLVGARQLLLGTDDPYINSDTAHVTRLPVSEEDKAMILGGNAARLLNLNLS